MTCIVGLVENGKVYLGADSLGSNESFFKNIRTDKKVFTNGPFIMGFTTSFRMGQILQYKLVPPKQKRGQTDMNFMVTSFIDSVMACFEKNKFTPKEEGDSSAVGGTFIVGYKNNLYMIQDDFQVSTTEDPFMAVGCGMHLALGSLHSTKSLIKNDPHRKIVLALEAASAYSAGVAPPFIIQEL